MKIGNIAVEVGNVIIVKSKIKAKRERKFLVVGKTSAYNILFFNLDFPIGINYSAEEFDKIYGKDIIKIYKDYRLDKVVWKKNKSTLDDKNK